MPSPVAFTKVIIGADHQGAALKRDLVAWLERRGLAVDDRRDRASLRSSRVSTRADDDYPRIAAAVARALKASKAETGLLICGSGNGMVIAANRFAHIRAALAPAPSYAVKARQDENANVLVLPAWWVNRTAARRILTVWLSTRPSRAARHRRRIRQLTALPHD
ncbi:MAG: RpiB/LacA/LacB family sugar-phosphate isomerase [Candidatus Kerfeldbacteria bacterium]|nr:RpiB/LacA/LacB family sugar-phosphate isomerase [Candidatus Kerfeldbacteria bacterium]